MLGGSFRVAFQQFHSSVTQLSDTSHSNSAVWSHGVKSSSHFPEQAGEKPGTWHYFPTLLKQQPVLGNKPLARVRTTEEQSENQQDQINQTLVWNITVQSSFLEAPREHSLLTATHWEKKMKILHLTKQDTLTWSSQGLARTISWCE